MKFLKNILKSPIRNTVIILAISLLGCLLFALTSLYLTRVMCATSFDVNGSCRGTSFQIFITMILNDFELIFRIVSEVSIIVLISQAIHRLTTRYSK